MTPKDRLRIRDALVAALTVRKGEKLDEHLIQERANNGVSYVEEVVDDIVTAALKDAARGEVITGEIDGARPRSLAGETGMTLEEHATDYEEPPFK